MSTGLLLTARLSGAALNQVSRLQLISIDANRNLSVLSRQLNQNLKERDSHKQQNVPPSPATEAQHQSKDQYDPEQKRTNYWRWISEERPPDANDLQSRLSDSKRAETKKDYEYIKSQNDTANYPAPKRLSSLKEAIHADLQQAQQSYKAAKDAVKEKVGELPEKAKELEHKIESRGANLARRVKRWVKGEK